MVLSALSFFISFVILELLAIFTTPYVTLLSSRGLGKVLFVSMGIYQLVLLLLTHTKMFWNSFINRNLMFLIKENWIPKFAKLFCIFFALHSIILAILYYMGHVRYSSLWGPINIFLILKTLFGLFVVFMLAWTEELIFRGTVYPYIRQYYSKLISLFATSLIFMLAHDLKNPLRLISTEWKLGLGLFLLGILLNQVFIVTNKLYTGMGIHAGLVFVKVILRRARFLVFVSSEKLPWYINQDLRQSHLVHLLFIICIIIIFKLNKEKFTNKKKTLA